MVLYLKINNQTNFLNNIFLLKIKCYLKNLIFYLNNINTLYIYGKNCKSIKKRSI